MGVALSFMRIVDEGADVRKSRILAVAPSRKNPARPKWRDTGEHLAENTKLTETLGVPFALPRPSTAGQAHDALCD
jgi:hypothetical protein